MITLLTVTRNRPLCFSLLEKWIAQQTVKPDKWLVVTDGCLGYRFNQEQKVHQRKAKEGELSICHNWLRALEKMPLETTKLIVAEDDDYYAPRYIEVMASMLDHCHIAGLKKDIYFRFDLRRFQRCHNQTHASLACTGFTNVADGFVKDCVSKALEKNSPFIDKELWETPFPGVRQLVDNGLLGKPLHVGFKGMPGEKGYGWGHELQGSTDRAFLALEDWIGQKDCKVYRDLWQEVYNNEAIQCPG